jgi:hypothetical protein
MLRALFLWFQFMAGIVLVGEHLFHFKLVPGRRNVRDWWGLGVAVALTVIAALEIFFIAYNWLPDAAVWPTLLALDIAAILLYLGRVEPATNRTGTAANN